MPVSSKLSSSNFLRQFRNSESRELNKLSAVQFMEVWDHYDNDENGFIEGEELDGFLREFVSSVNPEEDVEVMEDTFLLLFRFDNPLESSVEFMKLWYQYDIDGSGSIEADELKNFLRDLLSEAHKSQEVTEDKLIEYTDTMLQVFDSNKDGKLQLSEMAKLLPVRENFLTRQVFKGSKNLTKGDIEGVFALYDRDNSGVIENEELSGFLKDLLELVKRDYDNTDLADFAQTIMKGCDTNRDGKISKKELTMILIALSE